jgi:hypothetical protein
VQSLSAGFALLPFAFSFESFGDVVPTWRLFAALAYLIHVLSDNGNARERITGHPEYHDQGKPVDASHHLAIKASR